MQSIKRPFLSLSLTILSFLSIASGTNNGTSCQNAYTHTIGDTNTYFFTQQDIFIDFVANNDSLVFFFSDADGVGITDAELWKLYKYSTCGSDTLIDSSILYNDSTAISSIVMNDLVLNQSYYIQITKSNSTSSSFEAISQFNSMVACSPYNLTCGELITNGGFDNLTTPINNNNDTRPFRDGIVCDWDFGHETPQINGYPSNPAAMMWVNGKAKVPGSGSSVERIYGESILKSVQLTQNKTYLISFKLNHLVIGTTNQPLPDVFKVKLLHSGNVPTANGDTRNPLMYDFDSNISQDVADVPEAAIDLNSSTWEEFTFCFTANANYDRILFYPYEFMVAPALDRILLDDVSLKEFVIDAGNDITPAGPIASCSVQSNLSSALTCMPSSGNYSYSWTPIDGLNDPSLPNPTVNTNPFKTTTYTLEVTHNNNFGFADCSVTDAVNVLPSPEVLADGSTIAGLRQKFSLPPMANNLVNQDVYITGTFNVNETFEFENCNIIMDENARIIVKSNAELRLVNGTVVNSCSDGIYWNSIIVRGVNGGSIYVDDCEFYNSNSGIFINDVHADFEIKNSLFDKNHLALTLNLTSGNTAYANKAIVQNNTFECSAPVKDAQGNELYPTFAVKLIRYKFHSTSPIGVVNFSGNTFKGTGGKFYVYDSNADILANSFTGYNNSFAIGGAPSKTETALEISSFNGNTSSDRLKIESNVFTNNSYGITSNRDINLEIRYNSFDNSGPSSYTGTTPIGFSEAIGVKNNLLSTLIKDNYISVGQTGIVVTNSVNVEISENKIFAFSDLNNEDYYFATGILVDNTNVNTNHSIPPYAYDILIKENFLVGIQSGIITSFAHVKVERNTIKQEDLVQNFPTNCGSFGNPCPPISMGVRVQNDIAEIIDNKVEYTGTSPNYQDHIGISLENATEPGQSPQPFPNYVNCNLLINCGVGLRFMGNCEMNTEVANNEMTDNYYGVILDQNAKIGDIGAFDITPGGTGLKDEEANNFYLGTFGGSHTFNFSYDVNPSHMVISSSANQGPIILANHKAPGLLVMTTTSASGVNEITCIPPLLTSPNLTVNLNGKQGSHQFKSGNYNNSWLFKSQLPDSAFYLYNQLMYHYLQNDSAVANTSQWFNLSDSMKNTILGRIKGKNQIIGLGSNTNFDANLLAIETIMHKHKMGIKLNALELQKLELIASKCPFYDGIAVYYARSILTEYSHPIMINDCEISQITQSTYGSKRIKRSAIEESNYVQLFPNPSTGLLSVQFQDSEAKNIEISIYSVTGQLKYSKRIACSNCTIDLTELQPGIYFVRLMNNDIMLHLEKLIIQ